MDVEFILHGVRNNQGLVRGLAFSQRNGFPEEHSNAVSKAEVKAQKGQVTLRFKNVSQTSLAFSFFHDEKETGVIEKSFLGVPRCGVAASNWFGKFRPNYSSCLVKVNQKMQAQLYYF